MVVNQRSQRLSLYQPGRPALILIPGSCSESCQISPASLFFLALALFKCGITLRLLIERQKRAAGKNERSRLTDLRCDWRKFALGGGGAKERDSAGGDRS